MPKRYHYRFIVIITTITSLHFHFVTNDVTLPSPFEHFAFPCAGPTPAAEDGCLWNPKYCSASFPSPITLMQHLSSALSILLYLLTKEICGFDDDSNLITIVHQGWAKWSEWGPCSTSCGGGISRQLRRCLDMRCVGPKHRERICNMGQCNKAAVQAREIHCSKLDSFSNSNNKLTPERWIPTESSHQCIVMCRSVESGEEKEFKKMNDGTPCFIEGFNTSVCVNGICQHVGCDGIVQSNARYDHCGICGGNGETCGRTIFQWKDTKQFSPCDATCGPNAYRVSVSICQNVRNQRIVPERLCADQPRPRPVVEKCPHIVCPSHLLDKLYTNCFYELGHPDIPKIWAQSRNLKYHNSIRKIRSLPKAYRPN